jgi:hypothetical protein
MFSIRKLVGYGAAVLGLGAISALALTAQAGAAAPSSTLRTHAAAPLATLQFVPLAKVAPRAEPKAATPSAACTAATKTLEGAKAKDSAEDATERTAAKAAPKTAASRTADQNEDKAEKAAIKPLRDAVHKACGSLKPAASPQCLAALQALKTANDTEKPEDQAENASPPSKDADKIEDAAEYAKVLPLLQAVRTACASAPHHKV